MNARHDLFTPVGGLAGLICRGFTMRQIARLYRLRARGQSLEGVLWREKALPGAPCRYGRCRRRLERQRWPRF